MPRSRTRSRRQVGGANWIKFYKKFTANYTGSGNVMTVARRKWRSMTETQKKAYIKRKTKSRRKTKSKKSSKKKSSKRKSSKRKSSKRKKNSKPRVVYRYIGRPRRKRARSPSRSRRDVHHYWWDIYETSPSSSSSYKAPPAIRRVVTPSSSSLTKSYKAPPAIRRVVTQRKYSSKPGRKWADVNPERLRVASSDYSAGRSDRFTG